MAMNNKLEMKMKIDPVARENLRPSPISLFPVNMAVDEEIQLANLGGLSTQRFCISQLPAAFCQVCRHA